MFSPLRVRSLVSLASLALVSCGSSSSGVDTAGAGGAAAGMGGSGGAGGSAGAAGAAPSAGGAAAGGGGASGGAAGASGGPVAGAAGAAAGGANAGGNGAAAGAGGAQGDTWTTFAMAFYATYCVECHGAGNPKRDYTTLAGVTKDAALDRCGVSPVTASGCGAGSPSAKQFPINNASKTNPKPSDADRARIVAWIDAGLPMLGRCLGNIRHRRVTFRPPWPLIRRATRELASSFGRRGRRAPRR